MAINYYRERFNQIRFYDLQMSNILNVTVELFSGAVDTLVLFI